eukprot:Skav224135  [mRNA]  locus=scaffold462:101273:109745:- [translate_table: standard]
MVVPWWCQQNFVSQDQESGDGTNLCVSFGGELLLRAEELLKDQVAWSVDDLKSTEQPWSVAVLRLTKCVKTAISSKQLGCEGPLAKLETKGTVLLESAEQLMNFTKGEEQKMEEMIRIFALKINSKFELRRVCRTVGATSIVRSGPPLPEECGYVESIKATIGGVEEMSSEPFTIIKTRDSKIATLLQSSRAGNHRKSQRICAMPEATVVLRSASPNVLDELERAVDNAVNATEIELAHQLQQFGATAVLKFAEALEVCNAVEKGILDHMETKRWAMRFTLDAVLTVLKARLLNAAWHFVDQIIMAKQAGGPKGGGDGQRDDD